MTQAKLTKPKTKREKREMAEQIIRDLRKEEK